MALNKVKVKRYVVQDSWNEEDDQELRHYLESIASDSHAAVLYMSESDILEQAHPPRPDTMLFIDSHLVQTLLHGKGTVVDTYPRQFNALYKRTISKAVLTTDEKTELPYFIKLQGSNKDFVARVVRTPQEDMEVRKLLGDEPVYICDVVDFVAEFRLFLTPTSVWATTEYSEYMIGHRLQNADGTNSTPLVVQDVKGVPNEFVQQVLEASRALDTFVVVDVGLTSEGHWCVVECNPPFALSSYDLDVKIYVEYCVLAWQHLVSQRVNETHQEEGRDVSRN